jgi:DNA primase large subunit
VREYLAILIEGLDTRINAMQSESLLERRGQVLARVLQATRDNLGDINVLHQQQKIRSGEIISALGVEMEKSLVKLDLTKQQETALMQIIESTAVQIESVHDDNLNFDDQFQAIIDDLSGALDEWV